MKKIYDFLVNSKDIGKSSFVWNMLAYTGNSFQSMIILLVISQMGNMQDAAIFSIGFAAASMFLVVGKYAVRNFQVSDVNNEYTYGEYVYSRKLSILLMFLASSLYLVYCWYFKDYSIYKVVCVVLLLGVRFLESAEDVFHGHLQKNGRLDIASKIWAIRTYSYIVSVIVLYLFTNNLAISATVSLIISALLLLLLNQSVLNFFPKETECERDKGLQILKSCFPLALSTFLLTYIANSPKYAVDSVFSDEAQAAFNIICMPVFVISLLGNYIYNPLVKKMAGIWSEGSVRELKKMIYKQILIILAFLVVVIIGGELIGIRILEILYHISLAEYHVPFVYLMTAGGAMTIFNLLIVVATIIRKQRMLQHISLVASILFLAGNKWILLNIGVAGLCQYYAGVLILMAVITLILCFREINRKANKIVEEVE